MCRDLGPSTNVEQGKNDTVFRKLTAPSCSSGLLRRLLEPRYEKPRFATLNDRFAREHRHTEDDLFEELIMSYLGNTKEILHKGSLAIGQGLACHPGSCLSIGRGKAAGVFLPHPFW